jgi:hypothetical protein
MGILTLALVAIAFLVYRRQRLNIEPSQITLPADGAEHEHWGTFRLFGCPGFAREYASVGPAIPAPEIRTLMQQA